VATLEALQAVTLDMLAPHNCRITKRDLLLPKETYYYLEAVNLDTYTMQLVQAVQSRHLVYRVARVSISRSLLVLVSRSLLAFVGLF
jgi:hypothetical protein